MAAMPFLWLLLVIAHQGVQQHAGTITPAQVESGSRLYSANCFACHGANGDQVPGTDFRRSIYRRGSFDEDLVRAINQGIPGTAMVPVKLGVSEVADVIAYLRSMSEYKVAASKAGSAERGKQVFEKMDCGGCHRVNGRGAALGLELGRIGAVRNGDVLERILMDATRSAPPHRVVRAVTAKGRAINGRRLNEDTFTIQLVDEQDRLVSLVKSELRELVVVKTWRMPTYRDKMSAAEAEDLLAYLIALKGKS